MPGVADDSSRTGAVELAWTVAKWVLGLGAVAIAAMAVFGKKTFHVEIEIPAPPAAVWAVLNDGASYKDWNPVFIDVQGEYREGAEVTNRVRQPHGEPLVIVATVKTVTPERELRQSGGIPGLLTFDHQWLLEPIDGGTRVTQHEVDRGFWLWFWDSSWIVPAYAETSEALKARVAQRQG